jgi:DME family drug/metabolite transporter
LTFRQGKSNIETMIQQKTKTTNGQYSAAVIASGCLWGFMGLFRRNMGALGVTTPGVIILRCGIAALLFAFTMLIRDPKAIKIKLRDLWCFIGTGLLSLLFFSTCYFNAMSLMSLSAAAILLYTAPSFVIIISVFVFGEKLTRRKLAALVMSFGGCCLVCGLGSGDTYLTSAGILYGLGSGLGYALYSIFGKLAMDRGYSSLTVNFYTTLFAALGALAIWGGEGSLAVMVSSWQAAAWCLSAGVVTCYLPYMLYTYGLSGMEPGRASIMASVEPVVATFVGMIFYKESMTALNAAGVVLVLSAIVMLNLKSRGAAEAQNT